MIDRPAQMQQVNHLLRNNPVVALLGPRQIGKTTLATNIAASRSGAVHRFDLEDPRDLAQLKTPMLALESLKGLVILDEIQLRPDLFSVLRVLADRPKPAARFLVLGSAAPELLKQGSQTLAGRVAFHELPGLDLAEVGHAKIDRLWFRGGFPRSFLARSWSDSDTWRRDFIRTFLVRDLSALGVALPPTTMERFWTMVAHYHGQVWNGSELARAFGVSHVTVRRYLDVLSGAFVVLQLRPWFENLGKRLVRSPKIYIADSGLLHALLGLATPRDLLRHPKLGASWEGFMLMQVLQLLRVRREEAFFWATHGGAELDLLVQRGNQRLGFEFKRTDSPTISASMHRALSDLRLSQLDLVYPGPRSFMLAPRIRAVSASRLLEDLTALR